MPWDLGDHVTWKAKHVSMIWNYLRQAMENLTSVEECVEVVVLGIVDPSLLVDTK
jgi:hypothetical protein